MADANPAIDAEAAPAAPESKSKLLILILAIVLAAAGAGGGVYFFVRSSADQAQTAKDAAKAGSKKKAEPKAPAVYVPFDPPFVVNFEAKGMMRFLQVSIEVMTRDPVTADLIKQHEPVLRNELLLLLGNQTYETIGTREGKEQLRKQALEAVARIIGEEGGSARNVEQLYFTSFVMQ